MNGFLRSARFSLAFATCLAITNWAAAEPNQLRDILSGNPLVPQGVGAAADTPESVVSVASHVTPPGANRQAMLVVTVTLEPGWHIYSLDQKPVEALPTKITVDETAEYRLGGSFRADLPPEIIRRDGNVFEQYEGQVTWQAPITFKQGVDPKSVKVVGQARIQTCQENRCLPPHNFPFAAAMVEESKTAASGSFSDPSIHATLYGHLEPKTVRPGGQVKIVLEAEPAESWHVYALEDRDKNELGYKPTLIVVTNSSGFKFNRPAASAKPVEAPNDVPGAAPQRYYDKRVAWTTTVTIPNNAKPGDYPVAGLIGYQTCNAGACDLPRAAKFQGTITVAASDTKGNVPLNFADAKYGEAAKLAQAQPRAEIESPAGPSATGSLAGSSLPLILAAALVGGFILNFMPCVLPVIGLKILSFAEQSGHSRSHILVLNLWYALGVFAVFMALATLAAGATLGLREQNLGWGEQFSSTSFNIVMISIVFVMALSFLDVWEIPIPGFVGTGAAADAAAREGAVGAFAKGALSTVLATPCSGPFLGPVFGFTLNQPPAVTYMIFACVALGMASPYLAIGAFPKLIRFLPKPGAWMDTFKHMMGFVMLGTIVFLFTIMNRDYFVATFALMVGLWAACWWIGRVTLLESLSHRLKAWAQGAVFATVVGVAAFHWLTPHDTLIPWKNFSRSELARLTSEGHTVLVDFTADWCLTCKVNLKWAVETEDVRKAIEANQVVPLLADWTDGSPEIKTALESLKSNSIPLLAIYPAGNAEPIVLRDVISKQQVLDAIKAAGPSKAAAKNLAASTP